MYAQHIYNYLPERALPMEGELLSIPWSQVITALLTGAFAIWAWTIKKFGEQHIATLKELTNEMKEMRKEVNDLSVRVAVVEAHTRTQSEFLD